MAWVVNMVVTSIYYVLSFLTAANLVKVRAASACARTPGTHPGHAPQPTAATAHQLPPAPNPPTDRGPNPRAAPPLLAPPPRASGC
jgi:hypothetical protein